MLIPYTPHKLIRKLSELSKHLKYAIAHTYYVESFNQFPVLATIPFTILA